MLKFVEKFERKRGYREWVWGKRELGSYVREKEKEKEMCVGFVLIIINWKLHLYSFLTNGDNSFIYTLNLYV